jgi:hypothetical protein
VRVSIIIINNLHHTKHTVLHDIANDAKLVKVTATALGAERLLECDLRMSASTKTSG